jgi:adenylate kinase
MGMTGTGKNLLADELGQNYNWHHVCTRSLLEEEQAKGTDDGKRIEECMTSGRPCDDSVVIRLVKEEIAKCEEKQQSWIVSGFPQTKVQALALQRLKIVPDKFICINRTRNDLNA